MAAMTRSQSDHLAAAREVANKLHAVDPGTSCVTFRGCFCRWSAAADFARSVNVGRCSHNSLARALLIHASHVAGRQRASALSQALLAERLNEAAIARAPVTILYRDGSRESVHRVLPIAATTRVLRARDLATDRVRVFLLTHLVIVEEIADAAAPPPGPATPARPPSERELMAAQVDELRRLGWHVVVASERLSVHLRHSDGKPIKAAAAYVARNTGKGISRVAMRRPWTVVAPGIPKARAIARLDKAIELFMTHARMHAPAARPRRARRQPPGC